MNFTVKRSSGVACNVPRKFTVWVLYQLLPMKPSPRAWPAEIIAKPPPSAVVTGTIAGLASVGWYMKGLPNSPDKIKVYALHKSFGLTVFALVLLRRQGIAARYVSGYLWAAPEDGGDDSLEVATHAWLEALLPGQGGRGEPVWVGADPTNRRLAGETHVKIGHGRMYSDVPPIKGVFRGDSAARHKAAVTMTRLDPQASARA